MMRHQCYGEPRSDRPLWPHARMALMRRVLGIRCAETRAQMLVEAFEEPGRGDRVERSYLRAAALAPEPDISSLSLRQLVEDACFEEAALGELFLARQVDALLRFFELR